MTKVAGLGGKQRHVCAVRGHIMSHMFRNDPISLLGPCNPPLWTLIQTHHKSLSGIIPHPAMQETQPFGLGRWHGEGACVFELKHCNWFVCPLYPTIRRNRTGRLPQSNTRAQYSIACCRRERRAQCAQQLS